MNVLFFSLLFGGVYVAMGGRTPEILYFDLLFPIVLAKMFWDGQWPDLSDHWVYRIGMSCILTQIVSSLVNLRDIYKSLFTMKVLILGLAFYALARRRPVAAGTIAVWFAAVGGLTIAAYFRAANAEIFRVGQLKDEVVTQIGPNNYVASYLVLLLPLVLALFHCAHGRKKALYAGCSVIGLIGLAATFSRGALLALVVAIVLSLKFLYRAGLRPKHALPFFILGVALIAFFPDQVVLGVYGFAEEKIVQGDVVRVELWRKAIDVFKENPVLGIGPGQFVNYTDEMVLSDVVGKLGAHNIYLQTLAESGIIGSIPIFALMGLVLKRSYRLAKDHPDPISVGVWIGLLAAMLHNLIDSLFWTQHFQILFWLLASVVASRASLLQTNQQSKLRVNSQGLY